MGMFDRMYDKSGLEWQTKALGRSLNRFEIGQRIPGPLIDYQIEALRCGDGPGQGDGFATIRSGTLISLSFQRNRLLPLVDYNGKWIEGQK